MKVSDDGKTFIILSTLYLPSARFDSNGYYAKSRSFENSANASLDVEHIYADKYYNRGSLSFVQVYKRRDSFPMYQPPQVGLQPLEAAYRLVPEHEAIAKITGNDPNDNLNDFFYMGSYNTDGKLIFETELTGEIPSEVISSYSQERYLAMLKNGLSTVIYRDSIFPDFDRTTDPKSTAKFWFDTAKIDLSSDGNTIIIAQNDDTSDMISYPSSDHRTKEIVVLENKNEKFEKFAGNVISKEFLGNIVRYIVNIKDHLLILDTLHEADKKLSLIHI